MSKFKPCQQISQQFPKIKSLAKCVLLVRTRVSLFFHHHHHPHHRHLHFRAPLHHHRRFHHHRHLLPLLPRPQHQSIIVHHPHHPDVLARKTALCSLDRRLIIPYILISHHLQLTLINPLDSKINPCLLVSLLLLHASLWMWGHIVRFRSSLHSSFFYKINVSSYSYDSYWVLVSDFICTLKHNVRINCCITTNVCLINSFLYPNKFIYKFQV